MQKSLKCSDLVVAKLNASTGAIAWAIFVADFDKGGKKSKEKKIVEGDLVLVSLRAFQDDKCDIIHKYTVKEANKLRKMGEIPKNARIGLSRLQEEEEDQWLAASGLTADDDIGIDFDDDDEEFDIECI